MAASGARFYDAMNVPGGVPGYMLAGLIYRDGFFDSYEMPDDARYAIERTRWLHDLFHVLTGYGTDLAGEGLQIYFELGYRQSIPFRLAALTPQGLGPLLFLRPHVGQRRWRELLREAHARGTAAREQQPPMYVYWEELLPRPLAEVREELGIVPFEEDTSDWLAQSWLGRRAATGFGAYAREAEASPARAPHRGSWRGLPQPDARNPGARCRTAATGGRWRRRRGDSCRRREPAPMTTIIPSVHGRINDLDSHLQVPVS